MSSSEAVARPPGPKDFGTTAVCRKRIVAARVRRFARPWNPTEIFRRVWQGSFCYPLSGVPAKTFVNELDSVLGRFSAQIIRSDGNQRNEVLLPKLVKVDVIVGNTYGITTGVREPSSGMGEDVEEGCPTI